MTGPSENGGLDWGERKTAQLEAGPIHYRQLGEGEPLVFVHGLLVNGLLWRKVAPRLSPTYRCIVPDWPLGSHSTPMSASADLTPPGLAKIVTDFLEELKLDGVTLVANDTGGAVTQIVATKHPERVKRVVLTSCDMFDNFLPLAFRPLQWLAHLPGSIFLVAQTMRFPVVQRSPLAFGWLVKHGVPPDLVPKYLKGVLSSPGIRRDTAKVLKGISTRYTLEAAEGLRRFDKPVLLAWAREDRFFPVEDAQKMKQILPQGRLELIDDSYTFVSEDQPERLAEVIKDFLQTT